MHGERLPLHHGQIRVFVQRKGEGRPETSVRAADPEQTRARGRLAELAKTAGVERCSDALIAVFG